MAKPSRPAADSNAQLEKTLKQQRLERREREQHRTLYMAVGAAVGLAILFMLIGIVAEFVVRPNRAVATVGDERIVARDFWKRVRLEQNQLQNALAFYQLQEQQFGNQGFFGSQINQIQATLGSPFALGQQTLDGMIEERIVRREAAARNITVTDAEVDEALREEIANMLGSVTAPQATATWDAWANATATAALWTPTPAATPTLEAAAALTGTADLTGTAGVTEATDITAAAPVVESEALTPTATPAPLPTPRVITDTGFTEGLAQLEQNVRDTSGLSLAEYRELIRSRLLREKLAEAIGAEEVPTTEEQVHARHILISEIAPTPTATAVPEGQPTPEPTPTAAPLPEGAPTPTATPAPRTREEALALAQDLRRQIAEGADFTALAAQYSDDLSNRDTGGDLGWFSAGAMVPEFEQAAFALEPGQVSEPVSTTFGIHLIQVDEKDAEREKEPTQLEQERSVAFDTWLQEQITAANVERHDVAANLPRGL